MSSTEAELVAQRAANASSIAHHDAFGEHREHLTALVCRGAPAVGARRLCVLGAGNCNDLDLERVAENYAEIHLVDLDEAALERAWQRASEGTRARIVRHAPIDVSGAVDRLERWALGEATPEELVLFAGSTANALCQRLGGPFDTVLSACLLTQIQLVALNVLGESHRLFQVVRYTLALTHLRVLAELAAPAGSALLATDVSSSRIFPFKALLERSSGARLLEQLVTAGHVFYVANPGWLHAMTRDDPTLARLVRATPPLDVWTWQNGPRELFLVYAFELGRQ